MLFFNSPEIIGEIGRIKRGKTKDIWRKTGYLNDGIVLVDKIFLKSSIVLKSMKLSTILMNVASLFLILAIKFVPLWLDWKK